MPAMKTYIGNPKGSPLTVLRHRSPEGVDSTWTLAFLKQQGKWINLKLYANGKADRKANYWIRLNSQNAKFLATGLFGRDFRILVNERFGLYVDVRVWAINNLLKG